MCMDVSPQDFTKLNEERGLRGWGIRFQQYNAQERILIVVIPGKPHERLHRWLYGLFSNQIFFMGLWDAWNDDGATRCFRGQGYLNGDGADTEDEDPGKLGSSGSPRAQRNGKEAWPTLVIEAGDSSTLTDLRKDMRW